MVSQIHTPYRGCTLQTLAYGLLALAGSSALAQGLPPLLAPPPHATPQTAPQTESMRANPSAYKAAAGAATQAPAPAQKANASNAAKSLANLDDRAIIIVSGKPTTAGDAKKAFQLEFAEKTKATLKTTKAEPRKLNVAAFSLINGPAPMRTQSLSTPLNAPSHVRAKIDKCQDKGPPAIKELSGELVSGRAFGVYGRCFGDQTGSVELIGPFPGGKLKLPFTHWDYSGVILEIPANIRGLQDQTVAISVVTAEGKATAAMPVKFVAAREYVEVPERFWSPTAGFADEKGSVYETHTYNGNAQTRFDAAFNGNPAHHGSTARNLRINPQCALDTMSIDAQVGGVTRINGWDKGPLNEANVSIDWVGVCHGTAYALETAIFNKGDATINSSCRIAFKARAWAYCPAGISP